MEAKASSFLIAKNSNLLNEIFSFNNVKDHSQISQVSTFFNKLTQKFDLYYKEDCSNFFYFNSTNNK